MTLLAELGAVDEQKRSHRGRRGAGAPAARPPRGAHAGRGARRGLPGAGADHRRRAFGAGSARAADGARGRGRRAPRALRRRAIGFPVATSSCGSCRTSKACGGCAARTSCPIPRMREWRDVHEQLKQTLGMGWSRRSSPRSRTAIAPSTARCWPACSATSACATRTASTPARAASSSGCIPAPGRRSRATGSWPPSWWRPRACSRARVANDRAALAGGARRRTC